MSDVSADPHAYWHCFAKMYGGSVDTCVPTAAFEQDMCAVHAFAGSEGIGIGWCPTPACVDVNGHSWDFYGELKQLCFVFRVCRYAHICVLVASSHPRAWDPSCGD